jgi:hypothetical protein
MKQKTNKDEGKPEIDPAKLFDEKEFKTIIVSPEGVKIPSDKSEYLVLLDESSTREEKDEALKQIKEQNDPKLLMEAIDNLSDPKKKATLVSACWETGMDFSHYLMFFTELACTDDFIVVMEASTVILETEAINKSEAEKAIEMINRKLQTNPATAPILTDILGHLNTVA